MELLTLVANDSAGAPLQVDDHYSYAPSPAPWQQELPRGTVQIHKKKRVADHGLLGNAALCCTNTSILYFTYKILPFALALVSLQQFAACNEELQSLSLLRPYLT